MPRYRSISDPDTPDRMSTESSASEELPHASTLSLPELEALLDQQEAYSRDALGSAQAKNQEAQHLIEQASKAEYEAQSFHVRYEEAEMAIRELREIIVERNEESLERQLDSTLSSRALGKRPLPPDQETNVARKRVATQTATIEREPTSEESALAGDGAGAIRHSAVQTHQFTRRTKACAIMPMNNDIAPRSDEIVIYTNGQIAKVGQRIWPVCAIVFETGQPSRTETVAFSMEKKGPTGSKYSPRAQRAALRAAVGALELKIWSSEGFKQVIIATDNRDVFFGMTQNIEEWQARGMPRKLKNQDLWSHALDLVNEQAYHGCEVKFWLTSVKMNKQAFDAARAVDPGERAPKAYQPRGDVGFTFKEAL